MEIKEKDDGLFIPPPLPNQKAEGENECNATAKSTSFVPPPLPRDSEPTPSVDKNKDIIQERETQTTIAAHGRTINKKVVALITVVVVAIAAVTIALIIGHSPTVDGDMESGISDNDVEATTVAEEAKLQQNIDYISDMLLGTWKSSDGIICEIVPNNFVIIQNPNDGYADVQHYTIPSSTEQIEFYEGSKLLAVAKGQYASLIAWGDNPLAGVLYSSSDDTMSIGSIAFDGDTLYLKDSKEYTRIEGVNTTSSIAGFYLQPKKGYWGEYPFIALFKDNRFLVYNEVVSIDHRDNTPINLSSFKVGIYSVNENTLILNGLTYYREFAINDKSLCWTDDDGTRVNYRKVSELAYVDSLTLADESEFPQEYLDEGTLDQMGDIDETQEDGFILVKGGILEDRGRTFSDICEKHGTITDTFSLGGGTFYCFEDAFDIAYGFRDEFITDDGLPVPNAPCSYLKVTVEALFDGLHNSISIDDLKRRTAIDMDVIYGQQFSYYGYAGECRFNYDGVVTAAIEIVNQSGIINLDAGVWLYHEDDPIAPWG